MSPTTSPKPPKVTTRELSQKTWPDLVKLFNKPGIGDAWWCWCTFHHRASFTPENTPRTRSERSKVNQRWKEKLVEEGTAHGIIVYADDGEPIGWCQFGPREELPRIDHNRNYREKGSMDQQSFWRITCFVVDKNSRRQGVATAALKAVLESIKANGGGLVEAFPVSKTDQGPGYMCTGRVSMFERAGFRKITPLGAGRTQTVLMRLRV